MSDNQQKKKSVEEVFAEASRGKYIFGSINIKIARDQHEVVYDAMKMYALPLRKALSELQLRNQNTAKALQNRIDELEYKLTSTLVENEKLVKENEELREALEQIELACDGGNPHHYTVWRLAEQALKK